MLRAFLLVLSLSTAAAAVAAQACAQPLLDPINCCVLTAPATFNTTFLTTSGSFTLAINRSAAPLGVDRFYNLVFYGYFSNQTMGAGNVASFFRDIPGFVVQFGIAGLPAVSKAWEGLNLVDDPVLMSNTLGTIAFATGGPNTRTTQVCVV